MREVFQRWGLSGVQLAPILRRCTTADCTHPELVDEELDPLEPGLCHCLLLHPTVAAARTLLGIEDLIGTMPVPNLAHYVPSFTVGHERQHEVFLLSRRMRRDARELRALVATTTLAVLLENDPDSYDPTLGHAALACQGTDELRTLVRDWERPLDHDLLPGALELAVTLLPGTHWSWVILDGDDSSSLLTRILYPSDHPDFARVPTAVVLSRALACTGSSVTEDDGDDLAVLETVRVLVDDGTPVAAAFAAARALER